jgi:ribosomal protein S4E
MNTQEAIEYLKSIIYDDEVCDFTITNADRDGFNDIIALLQQGEKYRLMWEDVEEFCNGNVLELEVNGNELWKFKIKKIKQKYFKAGE